MLWIRLAILIMLLWLIRKAYKSFLNDPSKAENKIGKMVKCAHCSIHVPEGDAILEHNHFFCSRPHLEAFDQVKKDDGTQDGNGKSPPTAE